MTKAITTDNVTHDQIWLRMNDVVVAMLAHLDGGGWLWIILFPFCTGIEASKEEAGQKAIEVLTSFS